MEDTELLREMTDQVLAEAPAKKKGKKKAGKGEAQKDQVQPKAYSYSEALDFSAPLGDKNLYKSQGQVNWGPHTSAGTYIDDSTHGARTQQSSLQSSWERLKESVDPTGTWERLTEMAGCSEEDIDEAHIGFKKLSGQLAHKKGVKDPDALAAAIGRKKYGSKGMAAKAAAGHK